MLMKEDYIQSETFCVVRDTIKAYLLDKTEELLEDIMPIVSHLIEENDRLRKENGIFRLQEELRNPPKIIVKDDSKIFVEDKL